MNTPTLTTERLILRKFTKNDIGALYKIYSDKEVNRFLPCFPLTKVEDTMAFYKKHFESKYSQPCSYNYAVCLKKDDYPIGYANVDTNDSHDLSYGLCRSFWHRGIITEAGRAVIEQLTREGMHGSLKTFW